jgi:dipeptidyl aminopeptidase/acylaminoacyl peptidase
MARPPTGFELLKTLPGHGGDTEIKQLAWSPDGNILASCADDNAIILWDYRTGHQIRALRQHEEPVLSLAWSPDGKELASGSDDQTVRIWDPNDNKCIKTLRAHTDAVLAVAWSPQGDTLASGSTDGNICLWNRGSWRKGKKLGQDSDGIYGLAWSPDGSALAAACYNRDIQLWNPKTGRLAEKLTGIEDSSTFSLAWSSGGSFIAGGYYDGTVRLWDAAPRSGFPLYELDGHEYEVESLTFSFDEQLLASKSIDDTVRLWHCKNRKLLSVLRETTAEGWVGGIAFSPVELVIATLGEEDTEIRVWKIDLTALIEQPASHPPHPEPIVPRPVQPPPSPPPESNKVFIVHGHRDEMKASVARALDRLGLEPIILHEQASKGKTVIEKFEEYSDVGFAVVLLSPDDMAYSLKDKTAKPKVKPRPRARQNVVLELGFFVAKLGRHHVAVLSNAGPDFEFPSDVLGTIPLVFDEAGNWRFQLVDEMNAVGYKLDKNKI